MSGIQPRVTTSSSQSNHKSFQPIIDVEQNLDDINITFIPLIWSKNNNKMYLSPLFTNLEGDTSIIENLPFSTPITIFNTLFNDEVMDLIVS